MVQIAVVVVVDANYCWTAAVEAIDAPVADDKTAEEEEGMVDDGIGIRLLC